MSYEINKPYLKQFLNMKKQSYSTSIEVTAEPTDVFDQINDVRKWFKDKGFEGSSTKLNDEFIFAMEMEMEMMPIIQNRSW